MKSPGHAKPHHPRISGTRVSGFRLLCKFFHLFAVHCHLGHEPIAKGRAHDPEVLDDEISSHGPPLELLAAAKARELVLVAAQQEKATKFPAVRLEDNRLEALDLTFLLEPGIVLERFVEHLDGLSLTASYGSPETDEEPGICHDPPLCLPCGHHQACGLPPNMTSRRSWRSYIWPRAVRSPPSHATMPGALTAHTEPNPSTCRRVVAAGIPLPATMRYTTADNHSGLMAALRIVAYMIGGSLVARSWWPRPLADKMM